MNHNAPQWWAEAVFYQVYPRSFADSNGDGIGDVQGLIGKLDYLQDLGVDAVWLSPIFASPQRDFGYDISDYCAIDPIFGRMKDVDALIAGLHQRGMRLIMDGVFNHTSDQHPWFQESRDATSSKADWYIWRAQPNNWTSAFGGSAWTFCPQRKAYYLHSFASSQPDLNWRNPEVQQAILNAQRFWYDKGVAGFRLDVFNAYCKDGNFRDNPKRTDWLGLLGGLFYGYIGQEHVYDRDRPELLTVLHQFRELADAYNAVLIGETLDERFEYQRASEYVGPQKLHMAFDFSPLHASWNGLDLQVRRLSQRIECPAWVWSNHDFPRQSNRWIQHPNRSKLLAAVQLLCKGVPVLYYGEEIDQPHARLKRAEIVDPPGRKYYPFYRGRDGARTPMNWGRGAWEDVQPWLPVRGETTVFAQMNDATSVWQCHRRLIRLRKSQAVFRQGTIHWDSTGFWRILDNERWYVSINWTSTHKHVDVDGQFVDGLLTKNGAIEPYGYAVWNCTVY